MYLAISAAIVSFIAVASAADEGAGRAVLCKLAQTLMVCGESPGSLDTITARARLDAEFERISARSDDAALDFALRSFGAAELDRRSKAYREMMDRALVAAYAAPAEGIGGDKIIIVDTGDRYFAFQTIGHVAFAAGDSTGALKMVKERIPLVRALPEDERWTRQYADVSTSVSKAQAYQQVARDAAAFGDLNLAQSVVKEAFGSNKNPEFEYYSNLAFVENIAKAHVQAERDARLALDKAPSEFCEKLSSFESERVSVRLDLIQSLSAQNKPYQSEARELRREITAFCTYLSGHSFNFFSLADDLAPFAPDVARDSIERGRMIEKADDEPEDFFKRMTEAQACAALNDQACLLNIATEKESMLQEGDEYLLDDVAEAYVAARDYSSAERIMQTRLEKSEKTFGCFPFARESGVAQLADDANFMKAQEWLDNWLKCQARNLPNWETGFGEGGNLWSNLSIAYSRFSRKQAKAADIGAARENAEIALLLAIEAENTWRVEYVGYRARDLGEAYGAAYGSLTALGD